MADVRGGAPPSVFGDLPEQYVGFWQGNFRAGGSCCLLDPGQSKNLVDAQTQTEKAGMRGNGTIQALPLQLLIDTPGNSKGWPSNKLFLPAAETQGPFAATAPKVGIAQVACHFARRASLRAATLPHPRQGGCPTLTGKFVGGCFSQKIRR